MTAFPVALALECRRIASKVTQLPRFQSCRLHRRNPAKNRRPLLVYDHGLTKLAVLP